MGQTSTRTLLLWRPLQIPFVFPFFSCNLKPGKRGRQQGRALFRKASFVVLVERERDRNSTTEYDKINLQQHDNSTTKARQNIITSRPFRPPVVDSEVYRVQRDQVC